MFAFFFYFLVLLSFSSTYRQNEEEPKPKEEETKPVAPAEIVEPAKTSVAKPSARISDATTSKLKAPVFTDKPKDVVSSSSSCLST
jgi:hypothetical protein